MQLREQHASVSFSEVLNDEYLKNIPVLEQATSLLKKGVWLYFLLLIFEGALRKWFLPSLATPLLVIRDPLALWLIYMTWKRGLLPSNIYLGAMMFIGIISIFTASLVGHGSIPVALYGARTLLLHFPLMFVFGRVFRMEDVIKIGKAILWISVPMAVLITIQFYSPQSAWVNRGVGGDIEGAGFSGALGFFRPPATFSFTNGNHLFFGLVATFVFYFWLIPHGVNRLLLLAATVGLVVAIPFSISRSLSFHVVVTLAFAVIAISREPKYFSKLFIMGLGGVLFLALLSNTSFFQTAMAAFFSRFEHAAAAEGGLNGTIGERYFGGMLKAFFGSDEIPLFGYGVGMGTNIGSMLLTGKLQYLVAEDEWQRLVGELGLILGVAVIYIRLGLCFKIALASYSALRYGNLLPWMLLSFGLLVIPQGQWAQPTTLGFSTLIGGLLIASLRDPELEHHKYLT